MLIELEAHHVAIKSHPGVHLAPADVADHVVDILQPHRPRHWIVAFHGPEARQKDTAVVLALNKSMQRVAVGGDGRNSNLTMLVIERRGFLHPACPASGGLEVSRRG